MTNADVIRRMTDEQLDTFLAEWEEGDIDYAVTFCDLCKEGGNELNLDCDGCRKHWLKRDAVEYGGLFYWKEHQTYAKQTEPTTYADGYHDGQMDERARWERKEPRQVTSKLADAVIPTEEIRKKYEQLEKSKLEISEPSTDCQWK